MTETPTLTAEEKKDLVFEMVRELLAEEEPEELEDLGLVFDTVYGAAEERLDGSVRRGEGDGGLPFDASFVAGTVLGSLVWMGCSLVRARLLEVDREAEERLVRKLGDGSTQRRAARKLERRLDELLAALRRQRQELDAREADPGMPSPDSVPQGSPGARLILLVGLELLEGGDVLVAYRLLGLDGEGEAVRLHALRRLSRAPGPYATELLEEVLAPSGPGVERLGLFLGQRLLPSHLAERLRESAGPAASLLILSEEAEIPWEIVRLLTVKGRVEAPVGSAPALAEAFALAHWPRKGTAPRHPAVRRIAVVAPSGAGLPEAEAEVDFLRSLAGPRREVVRLPAAPDAVRRALSDGGFDVVHFTGHGITFGTNPDRWGLVMDDGRRFTAVDLVAVDCSRSSPLLFLNGCETAQPGRSLTGIGGIAHSFLEAGAGAVLGARWRIRDGAARAFAQAFYRHYLEGLPLARAVREARSTVGAVEPEDATRFAYTLLAHPEAGGAWDVGS